MRTKQSAPLFDFRPWEAQCNSATLIASLLRQLEFWIFTMVTDALLWNFTYSLLMIHRDKLVDISVIVGGPDQSKDPRLENAFPVFLRLFKSEFEF